MAAPEMKAAASSPSAALHCDIPKIKLVECCTSCAKCCTSCARCCSSCAKCCPQNVHCVRMLCMYAVSKCIICLVFTMYKPHLAHSGPHRRRPWQHGGHIQPSGWQCCWHVSSGAPLKLGA